MIQRRMDYTDISSYSTGGGVKCIDTRINGDVERTGRLGKKMELVKERRANNVMYWGDG